MFFYSLFLSPSSDWNIYIVTLDHTSSSSSRRETWIGSSPQSKSSGNGKQENLLELKFIYIFRQIEYRNFFFFWRKYLSFLHRIFLILQYYTLHIRLIPHLFLIHQDIKNFNRRWIMLINDDQTRALWS